MAAAVSCTICRFIDDLAVRADTYALSVQHDIAVAAWPLWGALLALWFSWFFLFKVLLADGNSRPGLAEYMKSMLLAVAVSSFLFNAQGNFGAGENIVANGSGGPLIWQAAYLPIRNITTGVAIYLVSAGPGALPNVNGQVQQAPVVPTVDSNGHNLRSPIGQLFGTMENAIFQVVQVGVAVLFSPAAPNPNAQSGASQVPSVVNTLTFGAAGYWAQVYNSTTNFASNALSEFGHYIVAAIASLFIIVPYFFVVGLFSAYLVESVFMFLSVTCVSPLLVICFFFGPLRSFTTIGLRLYLGAGLTLLFAGAAMGFTLTAMSGYINDFACLTLGQQAANPPGGMQCSSQIAQAAASAPPLMMTMQFWTCALIGFLSILLHLKAKTLASNFSGANDGAGPAAAVVAATKMAAFGAIGAATAPIRAPAAKLMGIAKGRMADSIEPAAGATGSGAAARRLAADYLGGYQSRRRAREPQAK